MDIISSGEIQLAAEVAQLRARNAELEATLASLQQTNASHVLQALRANEERFRRIFHANPAPNLITRARDRVIIGANPAFEHMSGYTRDQLLGQTTESLGLWPEASLMLETRKQLERDGRIDDYSMRARIHTGALVDLLLSIIPIELDNEPCYLSIMLDITERLRIEQVLRERELNYRMMFDNMAQGALYIRSDGMLTEINDTALDMLGLTRDEVMRGITAKSGWQVTNEDGSNLSPGQHPSQIALQTGMPVRNVVLSILNLRLNDTVWLNVNAIPQFKPGQPHPYQVFVTLHDVTQSKRTEQAMKRSADQLALLHTIDRAILQSQSAAVIAETALTWLRQFINCQRAHVLLFDQEALTGTMVATSSDDGPAQADTPIRLALFQYPPSFRQGEPWLIDAQNLEPMFANLPQAANMHASLMLPLIVGGNLLGSLNLLAARPGFFTREHITITREVGDTLAIAIHSAQLFEREQHARRVAELLHRASDVLARSLTLDDVLETLLDMLQQLIPYDTANVMLLEGEHILYVRHLRGYERWTNVVMSQAVSHDITETPALAELIATRRSLLISDTYQYPGWRRVPGGEHVACWLGVPLLASNEVVGIYSIDRHQANTLTKDDMRLAETLAATAGTAIARVQLFTRLQQELAERTRAEQALVEERALLEQRVAERTNELRLSLDRIQALYVVTNAVIATDQLGNALQMAVDRVGSVINADRIMLLIFDWDTRQIKHCIYGGRSSPLALIDIPFDEYMSGLTGWAIREHKPAISPKDIRDPRESQESQRHRIETKCGSIVVVPLYTLNDTFGTLTAINQQDEPDFTPTDVELMEAVASQISMAYARNKLTDSLRRANHELQAEIATSTQLATQIHKQAAQATALATFSRILSEAGLQQSTLLKTIAHQIAVLIGDSCIITQLSDDGAWRETVAVEHRDPERSALMWAVRPLQPIPTSVGTVGQVIRTGQALLLPTLTQAQVHEHTRPAQLGYMDRYIITSMLIVPMQMRGQTIGAIMVMRDQQNQPYTEEDQRILLDMAERAGLVIEKARLFVVAEQARLEAERATRLKDDFLASMSHELRTPLTSVLGRTELLSEEIYGPVTPRQRDALRSIDESGRHLLELINDILDLSKIGAGKLKPEWADVLVPEICSACLRMVAQTAHAKQVRVTHTIDNAITTLRADPRRLKQILVNLLSNAVKFTPNGGQVGLDVIGNPEQQTVTFTVWDTGIGIVQEDIPRLFQPFTQIDSRLSRQYEGTGLGLALVLRLAEAHDGNVSVESTFGQGSRFSVTLPWIKWIKQDSQEILVPEQTTNPAEAITVATKMPSQAKPVILLAEDQQENILMFLDYLPVYGYQVIIARDGYEAIAQAQANNPALILMDIQMAGMDGIQTIQHIRTLPRLQDTPIIALTALAMPGDRERCLAAGANDYLTKPISLRVLLAAIVTQLKPQ